MGPIFKGQESKTDLWPLNMMPRNCTETQGMKRSCFSSTTLLGTASVLHTEDRERWRLQKRSHTTSSHGNQDMWKKQNHLLQWIIFEIPFLRDGLNVCLPEHISGTNYIPVKLCFHTTTKVRLQSFILLRDDEVTQNTTYCTNGVLVTSILVTSKR